MLILLVAAWLPLIAVLPSLSLVRWLRRLSRGDLASLQETAQIALGVRTGFLAALYATLAIAIGGIFLAGFRDITYVLFGTEFLIGAELLLAGALESVLEFRLWLGGKGLDELKNADISTIWVNGRTPMRNFRDHFWALVPFYVRNRKNIGSIPPIERENGIILVLMVIIMLVSSDGYYHAG